MIKNCEMMMMAGESYSYASVYWEEGRYIGGNNVVKDGIFLCIHNSGICTKLPW
jgi:hypothetical protein